MTTLTNTVRIPVEPAVPQGCKYRGLSRHPVPAGRHAWTRPSGYSLYRTCPYSPGDKLPDGRTIRSVRPELDDVWKWIVEVD